MEEQVLASLESIMPLRAGIFPITLAAAQPISAQWDETVVKKKKSTAIRTVFLQLLLFFTTSPIVSENCTCVWEIRVNVRERERKKGVKGVGRSEKTMGWKQRRRKREKATHRRQCCAIITSPLARCSIKQTSPGFCNYTGATDRGEKMARHSPKWTVIAHAENDGVGRAWVITSKQTEAPMHVHRRHSRGVVCVYCASEYTLICVWLCVPFYPHRPLSAQPYGWPHLCVR